MDTALVAAINEIAMTQEIIAQTECGTYAVPTQEEVTELGVLQKSRLTTLKQDLLHRRGLIKYHCTEQV